MTDIIISFLIFLIYSIIGWGVEVVNCYLADKKWTNRGFMIGPYCPIYGCGGLLMTLFISKDNDVLNVFLESLVICSVLEYMTSYIMEKIFKTRWWDYSKERYNINGRICLRTMVLFGLGGVLVVLVGTPNILFFLNMLSDKTITLIALITSILFVIDLCVSYKIISGFKKISTDVKKDSTEDITKMVRKTIKDKNILYKRLLNSFPDFKTITKKYDKKILKQEEKIKKEKEKLEKLLKR